MQVQVKLLIALHATSVNQIDTIIISYFNTVADNIVISNISVSPQGVAAN